MVGLSYETKAAQNLASVFTLRGRAYPGGEGLEGGTVEGIGGSCADEGQEPGKAGGVEPLADDVGEAGWAGELGVEELRVGPDE
jgi:hypothetical protein